MRFAPSEIPALGMNDLGCPGDPTRSSIVQDRAGTTGSQLSGGLGQARAPLDAMATVWLETIPVKKVLGMPTVQLKTVVAFRSQKESQSARRRLTQALLIEDGGTSPLRYLRVVPLFLLSNTVDQPSLLNLRSKSQFIAKDCDINPYDRTIRLRRDVLTPGIATRLSSGEVTEESIRYEQHQIRTSETYETACDGVFNLFY